MNAQKHQTKTVVAWLDSGARRAILKVDVSKRDSVRDFADWTRQLPSCRHRLVAAIQAGDVGSREGGIVEEALRTAMEGLRPVVGCVQVDFGVGDYDLAPKVSVQGERQMDGVGCRARYDDSPGSSKDRYGAFEKWSCQWLYATRKGFPF